MCRNRGILMICLWVMGMGYAVPAANGDVSIAFETGLQKYLAGDLAGSIMDFSAALGETPDDRLNRELLAVCLRAAAKQALQKNDFDGSRTLLEQAVTVNPERQDNQSLYLRAELQARFPVGASAITPAELDTTPERNEVFSLLFYGVPAPEQPAPQPEEQTPDYTIHYTRAGETLATIAKKYYNDYEQWRTIWNRNRHLANPHRLFPGTKLVVPKQ